MNWIKLFRNSMNKNGHRYVLVQVAVALFIVRCVDNKHYDELYVISCLLRLWHEHTRKPLHAVDYCLTRKTRKFEQKWISFGNHLISEKYIHWYNKNWLAVQFKCTYQANQMAPHICPCLFIHGHLSYCDGLFFSFFWIW